MGAVSDDLVQADLASVSLSKGVGGNQARLATLIEHLVSPQHEVGDQVRASPNAPANRRDEVFAVCGPEDAGELLPAEEGRVADDGIEATVLEDLGELQRPVEAKQ